MAFYFSARGAGYLVHSDGTRTPYTTPAKIYFSGLGADEQLGYSSPMTNLITVDTLAMPRHGNVPTATGAQ